MLADSTPADVQSVVASAEVMGGGGILCIPEDTPRGVRMRLTRLINERGGYWSRALGAYAFPGDDAADVVAALTAGSETGTVPDAG
ncbi:MAG TPA: hypothetical protein VFQ44_02335 [Streptosporangiaceae bacterium]|nr:hypothetical protein [Streptosporangiaceae bacterium]